MLAVILIHCRPGWFAMPFLARLIVQICSFAVPFFFCASGFFFAASLAKTGNPAALFWKSSQRIGLPFLFWSIIYVLQPPDGVIASLLQGRFSNAFYGHLQQVGQWASTHPLAPLLSGTAYHLWFVFALLCALGIGTVLLSFKRSGAFVCCGILLYTCALLGGAYSFLADSFSLRFAARDGPFVSTLFVAIGCLLFLHGRKIAAIPAILLASGAVLCNIAEALGRAWLVGSKDWPCGFLVSTVPVGVGVFLMALALPRLGEGTVLERIGAYTFGIYLSHMFVIQELECISCGLSGAVKIVWGCCMPFVVYSLSLCLCWLLARHQALAVTAGVWKVTKPG
jgi:surface polysaccharide O-acyltransferase-like enzyme